MAFSTAVLNACASHVLVNCFIIPLRFPIIFIHAPIHAFFVVSVFEANVVAPRAIVLIQSKPTVLATINFLFMCLCIKIKRLSS